MTTPSVFVPGQVVAAGELQVLGSVPATYTPALSSTGTTPTMGSGAVNDGLYTQQNNIAEVWFDIAFGSGMAAGTGYYQVSLPVNIDPGALDYMAVGKGMLYDDSLDDPYFASFVMLPGAPSVVRVASASSVGAPDWVTGSGPLIWAQDDRIVGHLTYPADW